MSTKILVTGATGNVGRNVVQQLALRKDIKVLALTRNINGPVVASFPKNIEVVQGDLDKPETLVNILDGVDKVFFFASVENPLGFIDLAKQKGVKRMVLLSSVDPMVEVEQAIEGSGMEWVHVRPGEFMLNSLDYWGASIRKDSTAKFPYPTSPGVPIHEADIADVAVAALTRDEYVGKALPLSGPQQLTPGQQVQAISEGIGRTVTYIQLTPEEGMQHMLDVGFPEEIADHILGYYKRYAVNPGELLPTFQEVTGRPARTMAQWAADHKADFN